MSLETQALLCFAKEGKKELEGEHCEGVRPSVSMTTKNEYHLLFMVDTTERSYWRIVARLSESALVSTWRI